jgi:hypothetical protein
MQSVPNTIKDVSSNPTQARWFSPGTPVFSTNKTDRHGINAVLLKEALNTITLLCLIKCNWYENTLFKMLYLE